MFLLNMQPSVLYPAGSRASPPDYFNNTPYLDPEGTLKMLTRKLRVCVLPHTSSSFFNFSHKKGSQVQVKIKSELSDGKFITSPTSKVPYFFFPGIVTPHSLTGFERILYFFSTFWKKNTNCFLFFPRKSLQATHSKKIRYLTKKGPKKGTLCCFSQLFEFFRILEVYFFFPKKKNPKNVFFFPGKV